MHEYLRQILDYRPVCEQEVQDRKMMLRYLELFPDTIGTRQCEIAHMTASSLIFNQDRGKLLMVYHNIYRSWSWTGGHADGETDLLTTAVREAMEETGLRTVRPIRKEAQSLDILPVWGHFKRGVYVSSHQHLNLTYFLEADEDEEIRVKEDENSGVEWIPLGELEERVTEREMLPVYWKMIERGDGISRK